ncbi:hypothetical protein GDO81_023685 [Engystomops pustulosus]|uniref:WWE domain-containing protein n=1 Tax=Engystomops pustulosus TaxID=76066 RepID=A0AAV6YRT3_ENGPU|nr:hypothetical protein GDO81_023685 [Engystomops pustulosus]
MNYHLPYRWQIHKGTDWEDVTNMEEIEKTYCDPKEDRSSSIDFLSMRSGRHRVRRLSTASSAVKPPEYVLTTEWMWFWKGEGGVWIEYGHPNVKGVRSTTTSSDLELVYIINANAVIPFNAGDQYYTINFQEMNQRNILFGTKRDVRRRPKYLSPEDVKSQRGRYQIY